MDFLNNFPLTIRRLPAISLAALTAIVFAGVMQDYLEASLKNYDFYWSESLLFKAFWLPFIPIGGMLLSFNFRNYRFLSLLVATLLHLISYGLIIFTCSLLFLDHTYHLQPVLLESIASDLYKYLFVYSLLLIIPTPAVPTTKFVERLKITNGKSNFAVDVSDILWISTDKPYVAIHLITRKHLATTTLKSLQSQLNPEQFIRIHRSAVINLSQVDSYQSRLNGDYDVTLKNGERLRLSRTFSKIFKERLGS